MSERRDVLFELGTEELPPKSLLNLSRALQGHVEAGLLKAGLGFSGLASYATPRRLALLINDLDVSQPDQDIERRGPALNAAFQSDGSPTKALEGFLRSCNATLDQVIKLEDSKGGWVCIRQTRKGVATAELLPDVFCQALAALPIAKRMRWGAGVAEFVRPVHWVVLLLGPDVIKAEILGIKTGRESRGHRFHAPGSIVLNSAGEYAEKLLDEGHVLVDFGTRREKVRCLAEDAAATIAGHAILDADLLDEVTALVEWPVPVLGGFDARFLDLPAEVLITTMQANQKYFPVRAEDGRLLPHFITFSNLDSKRIDTVREGNERVVRPRLSDAEFFWNLDRKRTLESRVEDLAHVTFQKTLGSLLDKTQRVRSLAVAIASELKWDSVAADRAALLAKADLLTAMVGEFPELQGTMGRYYAIAEAEPIEIASAIEEQYLPKVSGGPLPVTRTGLILSLAEKLDSLTGIFSAGLIPTGDKDPYALRRAALGVIRICIEANIDLKLPGLLDLALSGFKHAFDAVKTRELVHAFILDRLRGYCLERQYRPDEFEAVLAISPESLVDFEHRLEAVQGFRRLPEAESLAAANKRIRNILRKSEEPVVAMVDAAALVEPAEKALLEAASEARKSILPSLEQRDYTSVLSRLALLRQPVDGFFDGVMVMVDEPVLRKNRLGLLSIIEGLFLDVADISRLQS